MEAKVNEGCIYPVAPVWLPARRFSGLMMMGRQKHMKKSNQNMRRQRKRQEIAVRYR